MRGLLLLALAAAATSGLAGEAPESTGGVAERACASLSRRVDSIAGQGPLFLPSFDGPQGYGANPNPALATAAFTYDNALAIIALTACGMDSQATRIGIALLMASRGARLRNAYRAGALADDALPNGWWDEGRKQWQEDNYQLGTATGNVAWAGLAMLTLAERSGDRRFSDTASHLARWIVENETDQRGAGGFTGGVFGGDAAPRHLAWKATEHNIDIVALFLWLSRRDPAAGWAMSADRARRFIDSQWEETSGHFLTGTTEDGVTENRATSGLDAQLWPLLLPAALGKWRRALDYAVHAHGVGDGFSFNDDRSGVWSEGTAQASLTFALIGDMGQAGRTLALLARLFSPGGYLWATPETRIATGLAIGPDSKDADFFYFHQPHLGATAWAALAALRWNPLVGRKIP